MASPPVDAAALAVLSATPALLRRMGDTRLFYFDV